MALDGIFLSNLCRELNTAAGSRIDKIFQPSRDEFVLSVRADGGAKKLILCARPGLARLHFTNATFENPAVPPMLCMLMRKYLSGGKIISIKQEGFERVVYITVSSCDEMGDRRELKIIIELIGNQSNIILVDENGRIIDSVRRSDIETSARLIQPGAVYTSPEKPQKLDITDKNAVSSLLEKRDMTVFEAVMNSISGVSPLIARELSLPFYEKRIGELSDTERDALIVSLSALCEQSQNGKPYIIYDASGTPKDFTFMPIAQYSDCRCEQVGVFCELLDRFYLERDNASRLHQHASDVFRTLQNAQQRAQKKLHLRNQELKKCDNKETYRIYGELIKANIGLIEKGSEIARVPNYYDENLALINIPLNPALSAAANSSKYFKDYRKLCSAEQVLKGLIEDNEREIEYLASIKDALERSTTLAEILDIKDELGGAGYIRRQNKKQVKRQKLKPMEYTSPDGYRILVGRNNMQNDELTLKTAAKDDIWLHTKNIHGSHVIICCEGTTPPDSTILKAACLAAYHSQARQSSQVPVDYTQVKHVKKPASAKPGMVIYKTNNTVFVTPKE